MLQLILQPLTLLFVVALLTLFVFDVRRRRRERKEFYKRVSERTKKQVDRSATTAGVEQEDGTARSGHDVSFEAFEATAHDLFTRIEKVLREIEDRQLQDVVRAAAQEGRLNEILERLSRHQAALERLIESLRGAEMTGKSQPTEPIIWQVSPETIEVSSPIERPERTTPTTTPSGIDSRDSQARFERLSTWLHSNMQDVVQRSLSARSQPETLTINAPTELSPTAKIADGMVLLIGTSGHAERLALVLPGSYIGARYYNWFEIPKGTNERVEDTVEPAVVREVAGEFIVVRRGVVRQS